MKVRDLIEQLEELNPEADVCIAYQPNYPFGAKTDERVGVTKDGLTVYIPQTGGGGNHYLDEDIDKQLWGDEDDD